MHKLILQSVIDSVRLRVSQGALEHALLDLAPTTPASGGAQEPADDAREAVVPKTFRASTPIDLMAKVFDHHGWPVQLGRMAAKFNTLYEMTADAPRNRYVATPRSALKRSPAESGDGFRDGLKKAAEIAIQISDREAGFANDMPAGGDWRKHQHASNVALDIACLIRVETLAATPAAESGGAVAWVNPDQLTMHKDRAKGDGGAYLPVRLTRNGNFTMPLYAHPAESGGAQTTAAALAPEPVRKGQCVAPLVPTEVMWGGLARDLMMWLDFGPGERTPRALFKHLERCGRDIPQWLRDEPEMKALDHVPSKGTRAVLIYRAMLEPLSAREGE